MKIYDPITEFDEMLADMKAHEWEPSPYTAEEMKELSKPLGRICEVPAKPQLS